MLMNDRLAAALGVPFLLCLPVNIYAFGDLICAGIQFPLFRVQYSPLGWSFITIVREFEYIAGGVVGGKAVPFTVIWSIAVLFMIGSVVSVLSWYHTGHLQRRRTGGMCLAVSTASMLIATMVYYGPAFSGATGFAVPVGVPLLFTVSWLLLCQKEEILDETTVESESV
jgi:hypothetical protein